MAAAGSGCPSAKKFSGKKEDWSMYKITVLNSLGYQFNGALEATHMAEMPGNERESRLLDKTKADELKKMNAVKQNARAVALIAGTQQDEAVVNLILTTIGKNKAWPLDWRMRFGRRWSTNTNPTPILHAQGW